MIIKQYANSVGKKLFILIITIYFLKSLFWLFVIPIFQTPDENRHYDYIIHLAKKHKLPVGETALIGKAVYMEETLFLEETTNFDLVHFSPLAKAKFIFTADSIWQKIKNYPDNNQISETTDPENISVNYYPPLYYSIGAIVYKISESFGANLLVRFYLLRFMQVIIAGVALFLVWKILAVLNFPLYFQMIYGLIFCFWPQLCMYVIGLSPDVLGMTLITALTYLYLLHLRQGVRYFYGLFGLLLAGIILVKVHFFIAVSSGIILLHLIYFKIKHHQWDWKIIASLAIPILISAPWFIHNIRTYHTLLPHAALGKLVGLSIFRRLWYYLSVCKKSTFPTAIAYFGWRDARVPNFIYFGYYALFMVSILSFGVHALMHLFDYIKAFFKRNGQFAGLFLANSPYYAIYWPLFLFVAFMLYTAMTISPYLIDQGRHYFPFIFAILLIFIRYARDIFKEQKYGAIYIALIAVWVIASSIFSLIVVWHRYYVVS